MGNCENCNCQNNEATPDQIAYAVEKFAATAILLHTNKILSDDVVKKANEIAIIALSKLEEFVKNIDTTNKDTQNLDVVPMPNITNDVLTEPKM